MARFLDALKQLSSEIPQGPSAADPLATDDFVRFSPPAAPQPAATEAPVETPASQSDVEPEPDASPNQVAAPKPVSAPKGVAASEPEVASEPRVPATPSPPPLVPASPSSDVASPDADRAMRGESMTYDVAEVNPSYTVLRDVIVRQATSGGFRTLAFVSAGNVPDRATMVAHLTRALVGVAPGEVLAIDADFDAHGLELSAIDSPVQSNNAGLTDLLRGTKTVPQVIAQTQTDGLVIIPSGGGTAVPPVTIEATIAPVFDYCRRHFPFVVVDVGAWNAPATLPLAQHCDAAYIVIQLGITSREEARRAINQLQRSGVRVVGSVLTGA